MCPSIISEIIADGNVPNTQIFIKKYLFIKILFVFIVIRSMFSVILSHKMYQTINTISNTSGRPI